MFGYFRMIHRSLHCLNCFNVLAVYFLCFSSLAWAEQAAGRQRIIIQGRKEVLLTKPLVHLGDIAEVSSRGGEDEEALIALQKIVIDKSPAPGISATISAAQIIERLKKEGVDLKEVGYILPRAVEVKRASRTITEMEIRGAIESFLSRSGREAVVKKVFVPQGLQVDPGEVEIEALPLGRTSSGRTDFNVKVKAEDGQEVRFDVNAVLDEWQEVPIAGRTLVKGSVVNSADLAMARLNIAALPKDVIDRQDDVIGLKLSEDVSAGQVFRRNLLALPTVVEAGARVTMVYRARLFEASATGIALEAGAAGQVIRVKNDSSKKIIMGTVLESGVIEVKP